MNFPLKPCPMNTPTSLGVPTSSSLSIGDNLPTLMGAGGPEGLDCCADDDATEGAVPALACGAFWP